MYYFMAIFAYIVSMSSYHGLNPENVLGFKLGYTAEEAAQMLYLALKFKQE